jgi:hypothetical protein
MGRVTTGITTTFFINMSFRAISIAARLTGSISTSLFAYRLSYSGLCQRVKLRPVHLFSLLATSLDRN